jgi:hypothetical protein
MAASESLRFDVTLNDREASDGFSRIGRSVIDMSGKMDTAAVKSAFLDEALKRQRETTRRTADATLSLAKSDEVLAEVEKRLAEGALEAEFALKREAEAKKADAEASRKAAAENTGFAASLNKIADSMKKGGGPAWLGPALLGLAPLTSIAGVAAGATIGIAGAAVAGAAALAAFGAVAKPVLSAALTAEQAVQTAQDAYTLSVQKTTAQYQIAMGFAKTNAQRSAAYAAEQKGFAADRLAEAQAISKAYIEMSPQQIALSKQLGDMANAWQNLKAAQTPVVAGALQPWLKSVTDLTGKLAPVIHEVSAVIGDLGTQFDALVNSRAFAGFRDFVTFTGSGVVSAVGGTLIDWAKAFLILLPKFNPLILQMSRGISDMGTSVLKWASSKKASEDITKFMDWFRTSGPAVGALLKNIGGALKALAPGLGPATTTELNIISGFFATIAKLPPAVAKPLLEVAGALLTLNKLGVVGVGIKLLGLGGGAAAGEAAAGGAAAGLWSKLLPGVRLAGGALAAVVVVDMVLKNISSGAGGKNWWDNPFGLGTAKDPKTGKTSGTPSGLTSWTQLGKDITNWWNITWNNTITRTAKGFHDLAGWFDKGRHDVSASWNATGAGFVSIWNTAWNNTVARTARGFRDVSGWLGQMRHDTAGQFDGIRHDAAAAWDTAWTNVVARTVRGVSDTLHWISTIPGKITGLFADAGSWLYGAGQAIVSGIVSGIQSVGGEIASAIESLIPSGLRNVISSLWHGLGFASGTSFAPAGWAWVGEQGPELMRFRGGEQVMSAPASAAYAGGRGTVVNNYVTVHAPVGSHPADIGRELAGYLAQFKKSGGWVYKPGGF